MHPCRVSVVPLACQPSPKEVRSPVLVSDRTPLPSWTVGNNKIAVGALSPVPENCRSPPCRLRACVPRAAFVSCAWGGLPLCLGRLGLPLEQLQPAQRQRVGDRLVPVQLFGRL